MGVKVYSLKKDGENSITKNFKVKEFRCRDGSDEILISIDTVKILQELRDYFKKPININSAYRTPQYNKKVGGASNSQHVKGTACDINVQGVTPDAVASYVEMFYPNTGCGLYATFVHIDTRGYKVRWKNTGSNVVSGFGLGKLYEKYKGEEEKEEEMTQQEFNKMMDIYFDDLAKKNPNSWSAPYREWAEKNGIINGDPDGNKRYMSHVTREEAVKMIKEAIDLVK